MTSIKKISFILIIGLSILSVTSIAKKEQKVEEITNLETVFVLEYIRHGARSHYEDNVPLSFFGTPKKGYVSPKGKADQFRIGQHRRREYVEEKKLLSPTYNPEEILALATFVQRCSTSGQYLLRGLYPLRDNKFDPFEMTYLDLPNSPLKDTSYFTVLQNIEDKQKMCLSGPVIEIPHGSDVMFHTRNCKTLHDYLNKDKYDVEKLNSMLLEYFTPELYEKTKTYLQNHFQKDITNLRQYFTLLDAIVAEKYQLEEDDIRTFQRQECFILSNNFVGPDTTHSNIYLSRMLAPMLQVFRNVIDANLRGLEQKLKYLIVNFHDTNISNILRFLQYFEKNGYEKYVRFSSSVRFELMKDRELARKGKALPFRVRVVFDGDELLVPGCSHLYCDFEEFSDYFLMHLEFNVDRIHHYCDGGVEDYVNELQYRAVGQTK